MTSKYYQFSEEHAAAFEAAALEYYDFQTCQRADGSYYGTGGQCRKGTPTDKVEKEAIKKKSGAIDVGAMSSMPTKQLEELSNRSELGLRQKDAIAQELKTRKDASDEYDKFGNQARTEAAQKAFDEHYVKKEGGYVPRPEKQMKVDGDNDFTGPGEIKSNIEFQRNIGAASDKIAMQNLEYGNRLQANGALKNDHGILWDKGEVSLNKMVDGNWVQMYNRGGTIGWQVNRSYVTQEMAPTTKRKIVAETRKMYETMVRSSSNNTPLTTQAYKGDGRGKAREKAYQQMGFSKPSSVTGTMNAKVVFGNVVPVSDIEFADLSARRSSRTAAGFEPMFSESKKKLTSSQLNKLWEIILAL